MKFVDAIIRFVARQFERHERSTLMILAIFIGVLGGYSAVVLRLLIEGVQWLARYPGQLDGMNGTLVWFLRLLPPLIGLLIAVPIIRKFAPETAGSGIPQVMESLTIRGGMIRIRVIFVKLIATALTLGGGASAGREGPIVQVGSATGSAVGQAMQASLRRMRILVGCGSAAALAATFNAPIAGVLFSLELLLGEYGALTLSPIVISSVIGTVVSRAHLGNHPAFAIPPEFTAFAWASLWEIGTFLLLGLVAGIVGLIFSLTVYRTEDLISGIRLPFWVKLLGGAVLVAAIVTSIPDVGGVGYRTIESLISVGEFSGAAEGDIGTFYTSAWMIVLLLLVAKIIATSLTLGLGASGGIFAPSLFLGAATGFLVGTALNALMPGLVSSTGTYALVGMAALVAGATHTPMTSIIILFEMTGDYLIILPVMLASISSTLIATRLDPESIFTRRLARRGIKVRGGHEEKVLSGITVEQIMQTDFEVIPQRATYTEILNRVTASKQLYFPVVDDEEKMIGILAFYDLKGHLYDEQLAHLVIADDLVVREVITLTPRDTLLTAFEKFNIKDIEQIPIVEETDHTRVIGLVSRRDLLNAYNKAVLRKGMEFEYGR